MTTTVTIDVLICGAGPVGLLLAYQLQRAGIPVYIIDRLDKEQQAMMGRATTLYPRTLEMLEQLDLLDDMNQVGYTARSSATYKDGKRVTERGWHIIFNAILGSYNDYVLNIRQKFSEDIFRSAIRKVGGEVHDEWTLKDMHVDESAQDGYKVTSTLEGTNSKEVRFVKSKYIIGADGGRSTVRKLAGIEFDADDTFYQWIRIDGKFKTNMPDNDVGFAAIESRSHGNVLWVQLDHNSHRIGFALSKEIYEKYGDKMTLDQAKAEAKKSMEPFEFEIEEVEWWTLYKIRQGVARQFRKGPVLVAGDACHTHSSGAAQGMNTGVHDSVNLGWKIVGVCKGWLPETILDTYDAERRPAAQQLIHLDKGFSASISGEIPDEYKGFYNDPNEMMTNLMDRFIGFNVGLGIKFGTNVLNRQPSAGIITAGSRGPDVLLRVPGPRQPIRLFHLCKNTGRFSVLVFAGQPVLTVAGLRTLRSHLDGPDSFEKNLLKDSYQILTILAGHSNQPDMSLGVQKFGRGYLDVDDSAHTKYGIPVNRGAIVVLRPDGVLGFATTLDKPEEVGDYFGCVLKASV